jgi:hypothetical protein
MKWIFAVMIASATCASLAAAIGVVDLSPYRRDIPNGLRNRAQAPAWAFLHDNQLWLVFALTVGGTVPPIAIGFLEAAERKRDRKHLIARYLQHVHERSFPYHGEEEDEGGGGIDLMYRISLFVPGAANWHSRKQVLRCTYRTDRTRPKQTWPLGEPPRKGLVTRAWYLRAAASADPPNGADPESVRKYLADAWLDEQDRNHMTWPNAGMRAEPIILTPTSDPVAILLIEAKDRPIASRRLQCDAQTLAMLLEHV